MFLKTNTYLSSKQRSKGKSVHSLFPSRVDVNSTRSSNPFAEINDSSTQEWFKENQTLTTIPTESIDAYSEATKKAFEPREGKKGDVARAMFYFYTVYRFKADAHAPNFFPLQKETLCEWNGADPVDNQELESSHLVASFHVYLPNT